MKIEKLNENQLKITLAPEDLSIRGLALNELSYGSPKTKELYNELVDQALTEFGFENEDGALVIEAIPTSKGNLVIFITKNQTADDLDTRFSRFSPDILDDVEGENEFIPLTDMLKFSGHNDKKTKATEKTVGEKIPSKDGNAKIFVFNTLDAVTELCVHIKDIFNGKSSLFKSNQSKLYFLILEKSLSDKETFGKICNIASEFSTQGRSNYATTSVINEHCEKIIGSDAVTILAAIN
jgi:hypothetical protein